MDSKLEKRQKAVWGGSRCGQVYKSNRSDSSTGYPHEI